MKTKLKFLYFLFFSLGLFLSCDESDNAAVSNDDSENVEIEALVEANFDDVENITSSAFEQKNIENQRNTLSDSSVLTCVKTISYDSITRTLSIDFGADGCQDRKGRVRKGKIIIKYSGANPYITPGATITATFENYYVNGVKIDGTRKLTTISALPLTHTVEISNGKFTWPDSSFSTFDLNQTRTWQGFWTRTPWDDDFKVTGGSTGTNKKGISYTSTITKEIVFKRPCIWSKNSFIAVQGSRTIVKSTGKSIIIDYGDGSCDNIVSVIKNGETVNVDLGSKVKY